MLMNAKDNDNDKDNKNKTDNFTVKITVALI